MAAEGLDLKDYVRTIPDWPKPGVQYRDITPLLGDGVALLQTIEELADGLDCRVSKVAGIDARGFVVGGAVAANLGIGFVPIRKAGKLPHETHREEYTLEYGNAELEIHKDAVEAGEQVVLIDDLIATGGTAIAAARLLRTCGADIVEARFVIDLPDLGGSEKLRQLGMRVASLISFEGE